MPIKNETNEKSNSNVMLALVLTKCFIFKDILPLLLQCLLLIMSMVYRASSPKNHASHIVFSAPCIAGCPSKDCVHNYSVDVGCFVLRSASAGDLPIHANVILYSRA